MKGVILGIALDARIVDLTHDVPPQDVAVGALLLRTAAPFFPTGTVHVAVVDPGVGTRRRALVVETRSAFFVGPDNGLLSLAAPARDVRRVFDVTRSRARLRPVSTTFDGRDVFAPIAARLAAGVAPERLGRATQSMKRLRPPRVRRRRGELVGAVIWIDRFGNAITGIDARVLRAAFRGRGVSVRIGDDVLRLRAAYSAVPPGAAVAVVNSAGLLEIAVNRGSAAEVLDVGVGTPVTVGTR